MDKNLFGEIIKIIRTKKDLTQTELAKLTNMSEKKLSAIECGRVEAHDDDIELLLNVLQVDLVNLNSTLNETDKLIEQAIGIITRSESNLDDIDSLIIQMIIENEYLLDIPNVMLYYFIKSTLTYNVDQEELFFHSLEKYINLLSDNYKALYYDCSAQYFMDIKEYDKSIEMLNIALDYAKQLDTKGTIYYHYGYCYALMYQSLKAYEYYQKAISIYNETHNFIKLTYAYGNLADIYFKLNLHNEAIDVLKECQRISNSINGINENVKSLISRNISWSYLYSKDYDQSIKYAKEAMDYSKKDREFFCLAYSYYRKNQKQDALYWVNQGMDTIDKNSRFHNLLLVVKKLIKDYAGSITYICKLYDNSNEYEKSIQLLLLDLIIEYSDFFQDDTLKLKYGLDYKKFLP